MTGRHWAATFALSIVTVLAIIVVIARGLALDAAPLPASAPSLRLVKPPAAAASPAPALQVAQLPADPVARRKFPKVKPANIDLVSAINRSINHMMRPISDMQHYGVEELWVQMPADMAGDCEDYALAKLELLRRAQFPMVTQSRLRFVAVTDTDGQTYGHVILELLVAPGEVAALDSNFNDLMTRPELEAAGYTFFDW